MGNALTILVGLLFAASVVTPYLYSILKKKTGLFLSLFSFLIFITLVIEAMQMAPHEGHILATNIRFLPGMDVAF